MRPWALTMPVLGEKSAPAEGTLGSRARTSAAVSMRSSTPLAAPRAWICSSGGSSSGVRAVMILVTRAWGTPLRAQIS